MSGSGVDLSYARDSNQCGNSIWMGYAGQSGGLALANVNLGQHNPSGRLTIPYYPASYESLHQRDERSCSIDHKFLLIPSVSFR